MEVVYELFLGCSHEVGHLDQRLLAHLLVLAFPVVALTGLVAIEGLLAAPALFPANVVVHGAWEYLAAGSARLGAPGCRGRSCGCWCRVYRWPHLQGEERPKETLLLTLHEDAHATTTTIAHLSTRDRREHARQNAPPSCARTAACSH